MVNNFKSLNLRTVITLYFLIFFSQVLLNLVLPPLILEYLEIRLDSIYICRVIEIIFWLLILWLAKIIRYTSISFNLKTSMCILGMGIIFGFIDHLIIYTWGPFEHFIDFSTSEYNHSYLPLILLSAFYEEIIFRGVYQTSLNKIYGNFGGIMITSAMFMLTHTVFEMWPITFVFSMAAGWIYIKTKSILMPILFHIACNLTATILSLKIIL